MIDEERKGAYSKKWYQENKERIKKERNMFEVKKRIRLYYQKNKEKFKEYNKEYNKRPETKEKRREYNSRPEVKKRKKEYFQREDVKIKEKVYRNRPEVIKRRKEYMRGYNSRPEVKARRKELRDKDNPENKTKRKEYNKKYNFKPEVIKRRKEINKELRQTPEYKAMKNQYQKKRRKNDKDFALKGKLRTLFYIAFNLYSKTGKIMTSKQYGVNYKKIIEHLGPQPNDGNIYEVDHIVPLCMFNFNNLEQIKKAFAPKNHQWLTKEINRWKGDRLIKPLIEKEKAKLQAELTK